LGLGHVIRSARDIVGDELFANFLPDQFMIGSPSYMKQMADTYGTLGGNLINVLQVPRQTV